MTWERGQRVRLVSCTDEWTRLEPGELGTVSFVDSLGTIHVRWDSGSQLGICEDAGDQIEPADDRAECLHAGGPCAPVPADCVCDCSACSARRAGR